MAESTQHRIDRNRPPRVQITYDVEIGNAIEKTEIPFVVGIMADLSGLGEKRDNAVPLKDRARSFVEIDRDNFTDVMAKIKPTLKLDKDGVTDTLTFSSLDDFNPKALVDKVQALKTVHGQRSALRDVLTKLDSNDDLYDKLQKLVVDGKLDTMGKEVDARLIALSPTTNGDTSGDKLPKQPKPPADK